MKRRKERASMELLERKKDVKSCLRRDAESVPVRDRDRGTSGNLDSAAKRAKAQIKSESLPSALNPSQEPRFIPP